MVQEYDPLGIGPNIYWAPVETLAIQEGELLRCMCVFVNDESNCIFMQACLHLCAAMLI